MRLRALFLEQMAESERLLGLLYQKVQSSADRSQNQSVHTHQKLDAWIQTNQAILGSNQELLKLIVQNSQALQQLTDSYESGVSSWQDCQAQLKHFDTAASDLTAQLEQQVEVGRATATLPAQLPASPLPSLPQSSANSNPKHPALALSFDLVRRATVPLAGLGALLLATGSSVGFALAQAQQPTPLYVTDLQEPLTLSEAELFAWAKSEEGRLARNLMNWNSGMLDSLYCTEEVKRLGVTLKVQGRPATHGFCTVWVVPPNKREFED